MVFGLTVEAITENLSDQLSVFLNRLYPGETACRASQSYIRLNSLHLRVLTHLP